MIIIIIIIIIIILLLLSFPFNIKRTSVFLIGDEAIQLISNQIIIIKAFKEVKAKGAQARGNGDKKEEASRR